MCCARRPISLIQQLEHVGDVRKVDQCAHVVCDVLVLIVLTYVLEAGAGQLIDGC
jgi:hypothetical protein